MERWGGGGRKIFTTRDERCSFHGLPVGRYAPPEGNGGDADASAVAAGVKYAARGAPVTFSTTRLPCAKTEKYSRQYPYESKAIRLPGGVRSTGAIFLPSSGAARRWRARRGRGGKEGIASGDDVTQRHKSTDQTIWFDGRRSRATIWWRFFVVSLLFLLLIFLVLFRF